MTGKCTGLGKTLEARRSRRQTARRNWRNWTCALHLHNLHKEVWPWTYQCSRCGWVNYVERRHHLWERERYGIWFRLLILEPIEEFIRARLGLHATPRCDCGAFH